MEKIEKRKKKLVGGKIRTVTSLERTRAPTIELPIDLEFLCVCGLFVQ
jgi:hypothetical protein